MNMPPFLDDEPLDSEESPAAGVSDACSPSAPRARALSRALSLAAAEGDEQGMLELLHMGADPGDCDSGAFASALASGQTGAAALLQRFAESEGRDIGFASAFRQVCDNGEWGMAKALAPFAEEGHFLSAAYGARREGHAEEDFAFLFDGAQAAARAQWELASKEGLSRRWRDRPRGAYEAMADALAAPVWACSCAPPAASLIAGDPKRVAFDGPQSAPEWRPRESRALGLPSETLLADELFFEFWERDLRAQGDAGGLRGLQDFHAEWGRAERSLKRLLSLNDSVRSSARSRSQLAALIQDLQIQRVAPFILVWGAHTAFTADNAKALEPVLRACNIDLACAGFLCANLEYGSFNARVARLLLSCHPLGVVSPEATLLIHARFCDLASTPNLRSRLDSASFSSEIKQAAAYFAAQAEALEIAQAAPPPRQPERLIAPGRRL